MKNLKRNWIGYLWSSFAPAFSCSSRSSPAFRCPVSPSARLPPTKIQAKRAMSSGANSLLHVHAK